MTLVPYGIFKNTFDVKESRNFGNKWEIKKESELLSPRGGNVNLQSRWEPVANEGPRQG